MPSGTCRPLATTKVCEIEPVVFIDWLFTGSLEIDKVEATDQGSYRCNASSSGINKLSNKAVLTMDTDSSEYKSAMIKDVFLYFLFITGFLYLRALTQMQVPI